MRHSLGIVQTTSCVGESVTIPASCFSSDFLMYFSHWTNMPSPIRAWIFTIVNCANKWGKSNYYCPVVVLGGENKKEAGTLNGRSPGDRTSWLRPAEEKLLWEGRTGMSQGLIGYKQVLGLLIHVISDWDFSQAPPCHKQQSVPGITELLPTSLLWVSPGLLLLLLLSAVPTLLHVLSECPHGLLQGQQENVPLSGLA